MVFCLQNQNIRVGFMHLKLLFKAILANKTIRYIAETNPILNYLARLYISCYSCLLYTSPSPRDGLLSRMPSSA